MMSDSYQYFVGCTWHCSCSADSVRLYPFPFCVSLLRLILERHRLLPLGAVGGFPPALPSGSVSALQKALASKCSELAGAESLLRSSASSAPSSRGVPAGSLSRLQINSKEGVSKLGNS